MAFESPRYITDPDKIQALVDHLFELDELAKQESPIKTCKLQMIDNAKNHYKFYHISLYENKYVAKFGRIGTNGQIFTETGTFTEVRYKYHKKIADKINKGYTEIK